MKDTRNITIAVLAITAVVLLALIVGTKIDSPAYASATVKQGDIIMASGSATSKTDLLYVISVGQRTMNVYAVNNKKIEKLDTVNLDDMFSK